MLPKPVGRFLVTLILVIAVCVFIFQRQSRLSRYLGSPPVEHQRRDYPHERRPERRGAEEPGARRTDEAASVSRGQVVCETRYFADWTEPAQNPCTVRMRNGYPVPDARCTPGGVNPSITLDVLRDRSWRTRSVRNCSSSEAQKHVAYRWYEIQKPAINSNENQVCELDHLVPLELGGADGLGNVWPQCGPDAAALNARYFKKKDHVENYLAEEVKAGRVPLDVAQKGIASDWTQYMPQAEAWCSARRKC